MLQQFNPQSLLNKWYIDVSCDFTRLVLSIESDIITVIVLNCFKLLEIMSWHYNDVEILASTLFLGPAMLEIVLHCSFVY